MKINTRNFVRIISFSVAIMLALAGLAVSEYSRRIYLVGQIRNGYNESLSTFVSCLSEINTDLQKTLYTGTPESLTALSANIYKNTASAKDCLTRLPVSEQNSAAIYKFLSQAGDFSMSVARKAATQDEVSPQNEKQLKSLLSYSENVTRRFSDLSAQITEGESFDSDINNIMNGTLQDTDFSNGVEDIGQATTEYPTLIYDGPFSDHVLTAKPKLLKNEKNISKEAAKAKAEMWLNEKNISYKCTENSATQSYVFEGENSVCAITVAGGHCLYMNKSKDVQNSNIYESYAVNTAVGYLEEMTGKVFEPSYYMIDENVMTVNLAYKEGAVICYSDLVKVGVSMDDAAIVSVEARGYIMNHHKRTIEKPKKSVDEARKVLNDSLTVKSCNRAVITDGAQNEKFVYEFHCRSQDDRDVLVYINTATLDEERLFILLHTDGGTLTR